MDTLDAKSQSGMSRRDLLVLVLGAVVLPMIMVVAVLMLTH